MKYIESLREGEKVNEVYLCKFKHGVHAGSTSADFPESW